MSAIVFEDANREQVHARVCLYGPGGSGKTYGMLLILAELAEQERARRGDPVARFAVIDTEKGRADKYVGVNGWRWQRIKPTTYDPKDLTAAIAAADMQGFHALGVDSGSLYWSGRDGMTDQVDRITAEARSRNTFGVGWAQMNPVERAMWDAVTGCGMHIVMTLRTKNDYVMEETESNGRVSTAPKKVGLKPDQRDGFEYQFDVTVLLDALTHRAQVTKSDVAVIPQGSEWEKITTEWARMLGEFCSEGVEADGPLAYRERALAEDADDARLRELFHEVERAGLLDHPVMDQHDDLTTLRGMIKTRGGQIREATVAAEKAAARATAEREAAERRANSTNGRRTAAQKAADGVRLIEDADSVETARELVGTASGSQGAELDVFGLLTETFRDTLGITDGPVTLAAFAATVAGYWERHGVSPATPEDSAAPAA